MVGDGTAAREPAGASIRTQFFAGMQVGEELARHFASGDIFLFQSLTENLRQT